MIPVKEVVKSVSGIIDLKTQVQVNGIDLTLNSVYEFASRGVLAFENDQRILPNTNMIKPKNKTGKLVWELLEGGYLARYNEVISVPLNACGLVLPRSSLMRMGATLHTALWDSGYKGQGLGILHVHNPHGITLLQNARIGQFVLVRTENVKEGYKGIYHEEGL